MVGSMNGHGAMEAEVIRTGKDTKNREYLSKWKGMCYNGRQM